MPAWDHYWKDKGKPPPEPEKESDKTPREDPPKKQK